MHPLAVLVAAAVAALAVPGGRAGPDPFPQALALEQQGKARAALAVLEGKELPKAEAAHRDRLRSLVSALDASVAHAAGAGVDAVANALAVTRQRSD